MAELVSLDPTGEGNRRVELMQHIVQLTLEHRDLDDAIERLASHRDYDALRISRMKRRKLLLKDQIAWLERQLEPDEPA